MSISVQVVGGEGIRRAFYDLRKLVGQGIEEGVMEAGLMVLGVSTNYVPIDTGYLLSTARVNRIGASITTEADIGYDAEYAQSVHEDLDKAHGENFNTKYSSEISLGLEHPRRSQEQAKFLEKALEDTKGLTARIVGERILKRIGR